MRGITHKTSSTGYFYEIFFEIFRLQFSAIRFPDPYIVSGALMPFRPASKDD
jgi:hypothetical protein